MFLSRDKMQEILHLLKHKFYVWKENTRAKLFIWKSHLFSNNVEVNFAGEYLQYVDHTISVSKIYCACKTETEIIYIYHNKSRKKRFYILTIKFLDIKDI